MDRPRLTRSETDRMIAGVAGGLGEFFNIDPTVVRLAFVLLSLAGGSGVLAYLAMWAIIPPASRADAPPQDVVRANLAEGRAFAEDAARRVRSEVERMRGGEQESEPPASPPPPTEDGPGAPAGDQPPPSGP